jgi:hypothetical protein
MQTLDLSGESKKSDGRLKSLFWPTVENAWDVDYLGQQGFWICLIIGVLNFAIIAFATFDVPNPGVRLVTLLVGAAVCFVYFAGGVGVRQSSWPAALTVFVLYVVDQLSAGQIGVLPIIIAGVLLSNVRATILAAKWKPATENEDRPMRFDETLRDKLVDQLPPRAWPIIKYPFYLLATAIVLMLLANSAMRVLHPAPKQLPDENTTPSVAVSP